MSEPSLPSVLFVCVKNGGKSQMAAALMRQYAGAAVDVHSAGTAPAGNLNGLSRQAVEEVGASMDGESTKAIDGELLRRVDRVIVLGAEAVVDPAEGMRGRIETWETDEPSERGIDGIERMRLVRDDIAARVRTLLTDLAPGLDQAAIDDATASAPWDAVPPAEDNVVTPEGEHIVDDLAYAYHGVFTREEVTGAVNAAWRLLAPRSTVGLFLSVLVARQAREQLMALAQAQGRVAKRVPEVLFVCVQNAGRSQMAAALTEHLSARRVHVRSAGSAPTGEIHPVVVEALRERGIAMEAAYPKPLTDSVVRAADVIVTMGCGDTCAYYPGKRYEDWDIADPADQPLHVVRQIRDDIQARVTTLLREILD